MNLTYNQGDRHMATERALLDRIIAVAQELRSKADSGGNVEHAFNLHTDADVLVGVENTLDDMLLAVEAEAAHPGGEDT